MTHEDIEALIDALNRGELQESIFRTKLSACVEYARVWRNEPRGGLIHEGSDAFYFLSDDAGKIVGAVFDMITDLHAVVKESARRHGHLTRALDSVILPHISLRDPDRKEQHLTFEDPAMAARYAKHWGFTLTGPQSAKKALPAVAASTGNARTGRPVTYEEFQMMRRRITKARLHLEMVREQLQMTCGSSAQILEDMITDLGYLDDDVWDHIEEQQGPLVRQVA